MACSDIPEYNFSLTKGDDKTLKFRYKAGGVAVDITGYVIEMETNILSLDKTARIIDPVTGEFYFDYERLDTAELDNCRVKYQVVFYPSGVSGQRITKFSGSINLTSEGIT